MSFKIPPTKKVVPDSPEEMYEDYKNKKIKGLVAHQADVIRGYLELQSHHKDLALQLPTGSGKTLVGLVIAEWRRQKFGERVLYICPNNQLVNQVYNQSHEKYGIKIDKFTGSRKDYDNNAKNRYHSGEAVAVTNYSSLFNSNPFFTDAQTIILDDAHSADNYISKMWSLEIDRDETDPCFLNLISLLDPFVTRETSNRWRNPSDDPFDKNLVDKLPSRYYYDVYSEIAKVLDLHLKDDASERAYRWQAIRNNLLGCHLYFSQSTILIRPMIPPSETHMPFAQARQRIYMSATLGESGDLERVTGVRKITRLPFPQKWETRALGRRFFFFPDYNTKSEHKDALLEHMIRRAGRSVVLVPSDKNRQTFEQFVKSKLGVEFQVFSGQDIEKSKDAFAATPKAVAILANRYDGIDFEGNESRLLIIDSFPRALNLQEKFIVTKIGENTVLQDRIRTRLMQAIGRCTRSEADFAAIVVTGEELGGYLHKRDQRGLLHPEIQAEIEFGISNSKNQLVKDQMVNFNHFLNQDADWEGANNAILEMRNQFKAAPLPGKDDLANCVSHEVDYQHAMWTNQYDRAYEAARSVIGHLKTESLKGYRTLWNYLAGSAALFSAKSHGKENDPPATDHFAQAAKSNLCISWFSSIQNKNVLSETANENDTDLVSIVGAFEGRIEALGTKHNRKFDEEIHQILDGLFSKDAKKFELAQVKLGNLIGYKAGKKENTASPDPWWKLSEKLYIVFEDHSGAGNTATLSATKARQAFSHPNWIIENLKPHKDARIISALITPAIKLEEGAEAHLREVKFWPLADFRAWVKDVIATIRDLRTEFIEPDLVWRASVADRYRALNLDPEGMKRFLEPKTVQKVIETGKS